MGATFSNYHIQAESSDPVVQELAHLLRSPAYISPSTNGWVSVYISPHADRKESDSKRIAKELSSRLGAVVFAFDLFDSDIFHYSLYASGEARDEYDSNPSYWKKAGRKTQERLRGRPEEVVRYCLPGTSVAAVEACLHPEVEPIFAEDLVMSLAHLLGVRDEWACQGFSDIEEQKKVDPAYAEFRIAELNVSQEHKDSALWSAVMYGQVDKIRTLIRAGASFNITDKHSGVPLFIRAVEYCNPAVIKTLLELGADANVKMTADGDEFAAQFRGWGRRVISPFPWEKGVTPLMVAAGHSSEYDNAIEAVKILLATGADVNAISEIGRTALSEALPMTVPAAHQGRIGRMAPPDVLEKAAERSAHIAQMLHDAGATR